MNRHQRRHIASDNRIVHKLVKSTAQEFAGCFYEWQAGQKRYGDEFYNLYPNVDAFVKRDWPNFVKEAKAVMAMQLGDPITTDTEKADLYEALTLDATMPYSEQEVQITNFKH